MLSRLPMILAQLQTGNNSHKLKKRDSATTTFVISFKRSKPKQFLKILSILFKK